MTWLIDKALTLWGGLKLYAAILFAVAVALAGAWLRGRSAGVAAAKAKRDAERLAAAKKAKEIDDDVANLGPADLDQRYARWLRDQRER